MNIHDDLNILNRLANDLNNEIINYARQTIVNLQDNYCLSKEHIIDILGLNKKEYEALMDNNAFAEISSGLMSVLYLLTNGGFDISCIPSLKDCKLYNFTELLSYYKKEKHIEKIENFVKELGLTNDEDIDNMTEFVKALKGKNLDL